jgi:hypothetical protein
VPALREYLLDINPSSRGAIKQLLARRFYDCTAAPKDEPKNCYETVAYVKGLDYLSRRRVQDENIGPIMAAPGAVRELFAAGGYRKVAETFLFRIEKKRGTTGEVIASADLSAIPKNLRIGDILLFGGRGVDRQGTGYDRYVHAMIYLGERRGKHYVFEKWNGECGPRSPYQIIALEAILKQQVGTPATYKDVYIDRLFVLRKL